MIVHTASFLSARAIAPAIEGIDTGRRAHPAEGKPQQSQSVVVHDANSEIYAQGEEAGALYQVEFGAVRIYRLLADGRRQISAFHVAGEVFGFESDDRHHFFAEAICASGIRVFARPVDPDWAREVLPLVIEALVRAQEHQLVIGRQNAVERVAAFLTDMIDRQGGLPEIELPMSRADIADYLGLTIETVSRAFSKFKAKGYIRLRGARSAEILRVDDLRTLSS